MEARSRELIRIGIATFSVLYSIGLVISYWVQGVPLLEVLAGIFHMDVLGCTSALTFVIVFLMNRWLWRFLGITDMPYIAGDYNGLIDYEWEGKRQCKESQRVYIEQTFLVTRVTIETDEVRSTTITSDFVEQYGSYVLYYTYATNPNAFVRDTNPPQTGACNLTFRLDGTLKGTYWTDRKTRGEITLTKRRKR